MNLLLRLGLVRGQCQPFQRGDLAIRELLLKSSVHRGLVGLQ
jgi:hypothetical protein